jgi:hypothetical protein
MMNGLKYSTYSLSASCGFVVVGGYSVLVMSGDTIHVCHILSLVSNYDRLISLSKA